LPDAAYCERFVGVPEQLRDLGVANPTRERPRGLALTDNEEDSEDEVDENEELWRTQDALDGFGHLESSNWAQRLHEVLGADGARWAATKARLGVVACNAGVGPAAAIALGELLPHSAVDLCVAEFSEAAASLAVRAATCRPRVAYCSFRHFASGKGFCEADHCPDKALPDASEETLLFGCLVAMPFVGATEEISNIESDPRSLFEVSRRHLLKFKPPLALLEVTDRDCLTDPQLADALKSMLDNPVYVCVCVFGGLCVWVLLCCCVCVCVCVWFVFCGLCGMF